MTPHDEMLDVDHCRRKELEYSDKAKAAADPKLKSAYEATAREYAHRLRQISGISLSPFYRHKADQCHRLAEVALRSDIRQSYEMERHWNGIAEREERKERLSPIALD
jgi:hypothetical protein